MSKMSSFESRKGEMDCSPEELYNFVTDMRNFQRFIPAGTITDWEAGTDSCSFTFSHAGDVAVRLDRKEPFSLVSYRGNALKDNDFELILYLGKSDGNRTSIKIDLNAELNPFIKMVAANPIRQFMETVIDRMENIDCSEIRK